MEDKKISNPYNTGIENYNIPQQIGIIKNFVYIIEIY